MVGEPHEYATHLSNHGLGTDYMKRQQILRTVNAARSVQTMAQQASAYVNASTVPSGLPRYVHLETVSDWSTSALLVTAIESIMLPTRIRAAGGRQAPLPFLEAALNTNGRQNIFELSASVFSHGVESQQNGFTSGTDNAVLSHGDSSQMMREEDSSQQISTLDINYTTELPQQSIRPSEHTFSQVAVRRGRNVNGSSGIATDHNSEDMVRMPGVDTVVEKYVTFHLSNACVSRNLGKLLIQFY